MKKIVKYARYMTLIGLILLLIPIVFNLSAPNPLFTIFGGLGIILIFATLILYAYIWFKEVRLALETKDYLMVFVLICIAVWFVFKFVRA